MVAPLITIIGLLVAITALAWLAQRIRIEYPILLVLGGLVLGFVPGLPAISLQPDIVFLLFLPPLLYYEAYGSSLRDYRANLGPIFLLAVVLVVVSIFGVAFVARALVPGMSWAVAIVFGAIVGPTDETAAIAIANRMRVPRRLITLIKAESLFNDATSLVIYSVALTAVVAGTFSPSAAVLSLFVDTVGGAAIGLAIGWLLTMIRRRLDDPLTQNTASLLSGYIAYYAADTLHWSGVLATIAAGIYLGRNGHTFTTPESRIQNQGMREVTLFIINGMLFIMVGLQLHPILSGLQQFAPPAQLFWLAADVSLTIVGIRVAWMYFISYVPRLLLPQLRQRAARSSWQIPLAASWAGMRGGVSLAAALALPFTVATGAPFPYRQLILFLTFGVILTTLVGQGLTMAPLIRMLGLTTDGDIGREETLARLKATRVAASHLKAIAKQPWADPAVVEDALRHLRQNYVHYKGHSDETMIEPEVELRDKAGRRIQSELADAQRDEILRLRDEGAISDAVMNKLQRELDLDDLRRELGSAPDAS